MTEGRLGTFNYVSEVSSWHHCIAQVHWEGSRAHGGL